MFYADLLTFVYSLSLSCTFRMARCFHNVRLPIPRRPKVYEEHVLKCTPVTDIAEHSLRQLLEKLEMQARK